MLKNNVEFLAYINSIPKSYLSCTVFNENSFYIKVVVIDKIYKFLVLRVFI